MMGTEGRIYNFWMGSRCRLGLKAVYFDLFETLISEFADGQRISKRHYDYMELLGIEWKDFKAEWGSRQQKRMTGELPNFPAVIEDILRKRGLPPRDESVRQLLEERVKEKVLPFLHIRPDIVAMLEKLRQQGMRLGLISNCTEEEVTYWEKSELAPYFDDVIFSYKVGLAKPDPRIYRLGCERLSVAPEEALFVGDGGSDELNGAFGAGLHVVHAVWFNATIGSDFRRAADPMDIVKELDGKKAAG